MTMVKELEVTTRCSCLPQLSQVSMFYGKQCAFGD
jgi:hypothetical protein